MALELVICVIGVIANLIVITVILILRDYRKALTHWYVLQLAIADCIFLLTIPFDFSEGQNGGWIYSNWMCKAKETILFLNYHASILFLVVMSMDRYVAVCQARSNLQTKLRNRSVSVIITLLTWGLALLFCIPVMVYSSKIEDNGHCICGYLFPKQYHSYCSEHVAEFSVDICAEMFQSEIQRKLDRCVSGWATNESNIISYKDDNILDYSGNRHSLGWITNQTTMVISTEDQNFDYSGIDSSSGNSSEGYENSGDYGFPKSSKTCNYDFQGPGWFAYTYFLFAGMFIIPLLIMTYCYLCIIRQLRRTRVGQARSEDDRRSSSRPLNRRSRRLSSSSEKTKNKITRVNVTCTALVVTFIIFWLPFHSYHLAKINGIHKSDEFCAKLQSVVSLLIYVNSTLNPLIYNFIGTNFVARLRKTGERIKFTIGRSSASSLRGTKVRYHKRQGGSRSSNRGISMTMKTNKSSFSSSNGPRTNLSMVAMPGSIADSMSNGTDTKQLNTVADSSG